MSPENDDLTNGHGPSLDKVPLNKNNNLYNPHQIVTDLDSGGGGGSGNGVVTTSKYNTNKLDKLNGSTTTNNNNTKNLNINNGTSKENKTHRWSPLSNNGDEQNKNNLSISEVIDNNKIVVNNNEYKATPVLPSSLTTNVAPANDVIKNGYKEIPQIEDDGTLKHHQPINNNGSFLNGNSNGGAQNGNGHPEKYHAEHDPLTGQQRIPELDEISHCGIGSYSPKWARNFASTHVFMVVFLLAWVLQGMYFTYFVSVITTIEKLFQIKSKITGMLMSATEVGQICTSLFLTYYAGRGHRPRWIACGMILFSISSFCCTIPHFIFGDQLLHASNVFNNIGSKTTDLSLNLCMNRTSLSGVAFNYTAANECEDEILVEQAAHSQITTIVLVILTVSLLGVGVGQTAVSTLGIPYIDDNVASRESPIYIAITIGVRILGPAAGFILGSFCTRVYVDLSIDPMITPQDPKWVGAWWLGLLLVSSLMAITSLAMFTFPKKLKGNRIQPPSKLRAIEAQKKPMKPEEEPKTPQLKDFPKTIKRQLSNDILMFRTASSVLHLLPVAGLYTFLPKYMESQFRLTAHEANLITGVGGILVMGVGIVISGVVILKVSPTARSVAAWIAFTALAYSCGMAILMFVGCPMNNFKGLQLNNQEQLPKFTPFLCNSTATCDCDTKKFAPICGSDNFTYFSACHAGCGAHETINGKIKFTECQCIDGPNFDTSLTTPAAPLSRFEAVNGYCDGKCQTFIAFTLIFSFFVFIHSTSEVGSMLLIMRCTDPKDKAMAMGVIQFAIGLFGNVPCPIIYGAVVDSACLVWDTVCGKQGACSLYDGDTFRHFFFGTTSGIMLLAFFMDLVVWHKAHRIDIDPESRESEGECGETTPAVQPDTTV